MPANIRTIEDAQKVIESFKESENVTRKQNAFIDYQILMGEQRKLVERKIRAEFPDSYDEMRIIEFNFCKKIINKRASLYKDGINRTVLIDGEKDEQQQAVYDAAWQDIDINNVMKKTNMFYEAFNIGTIQLLLNDDYTLKARVHPHFLIDVYPDLMGNEDVVGFSHYVDDGTMRITSDKYTDVESKIWSLWSKDSHALVKEYTAKGTTDKDYSFLNLKGNDEQENPAQELPFIIVKAPIDGFYYPMRNFIGLQCFNINMILTDIASIARNQGFGQAVLIAHSTVMPENVKVGIKSLLKIPIPEGEAGGQTRFDYITSNAPIGEQMAAASEFLQMLLSTNDLASTDVGGKMDAVNPMSGVARLIESSKLTQALDGAKSIFVKAEKDLFKLVTRYLDMLSEKGQLPENYKGYRKADSELKLDFQETKPIQGEEDKLNMIERKIELGLIHSWEKHQIMNADLTDEEAQAREEEIQEEKQEALKKHQEMFGDMGEEKEDEEEKQVNPFEKEEKKEDAKEEKK